MERSKANHAIRGRIRQKIQCVQHLSAVLVTKTELWAASGVLPARAGPPGTHLRECVGSAHHSDCAIRCYRAGDGLRAIHVNRRCSFGSRRLKLWEAPRPAGVRQPKNRVRLLDHGAGESSYRQQQRVLAAALAVRGSGARWVTWTKFRFAGSFRADLNIKQARM